MDGYLLIDKPEGISSFGAVAKVRRLISQELGRKVKVGHTGTLDPSASGLLILVIGKYTKKAGEFSRLYKTYDAEISLGAVSTTSDAEGVIQSKSTHKPSAASLKQALSSFLGDIEQVPPIYSAVKVAGQRAYALARAGKSPQLKPRKVTVYEIKNVKYKYPIVSFTVTVSSGTYIRSLAQDIGEKLAVGAYLSRLRRTEVADYSVKDAVRLDNLTVSVIIENVKQIPPK